MACINGRPPIFAPRPWAAYSALRGVLNPLTDAVLDRDKTTHDLLRQIERQREASRNLDDEHAARAMGRDNGR